MRKEISLNQLQSQRFIAGVYEEYERVKEIILKEGEKVNWPIEERLRAAENIGILYYWSKYWE